MNIDYTILITALSIIGVVLNIYKSKICFVIWIFTNAFWCIIDYKVGLHSQAILFFVYFILACYGLIRWIKDDKKEKKDGKR
jgi:nicotinamide riboside transporter PnuC